MKRKISLIVLTAVLAAASAIGLVACGDQTGAACTEHSWDGGKVTREATCALAGERTYTCTVCKETRTEAIAKSTVHSWDEGEVDQPDITVEGTVTYTCTVCGDFYSEPVPAHTEHEWDEGSQLKAPTCSEKGSMKYECEICHTTKTEDISATGEHRFDTFVETVTEPTCATAGSATYRCTTCTETQDKEVPATGKHTLEWTFEGGEHWQECSGADCDYATAKEAHGESDWTESGRVPADCANAGHIDYECKCGATRSEPIPSTGEHNFVLKETTTPATCGAAGSGVYECSGCRAQETREIPATGEHNFEPKFTQTQHYTECSVCHTETPRENHAIGYAVDKQATLYETGLRHPACSGCEYRGSDESYELENFVTDYRSGVAAENTSGWEYGLSDYKWSAPTEGRLPGNTDNKESFVFTKSTEFNGEAWLVKEGDTVRSEIKAGWLNGNWSTLAYTVGEDVSGAAYTVALGYKYNPHTSHADLYTNANVRIAVLTQEGTCKYSEFIALDGHGANATRDISNLNAGDKIYVFIELVEAKQMQDETVINSSWSNGDFTCRIFEKQPE